MSQPSIHQPVNGIPAATLIVFRQPGPKETNQPGVDITPPEILMVTRARSMAFAAGAAVFPGGRVDPEDYQLAAHQPHLNEQDDIAEAAHRIAAIRETLEETGLATGMAGLTGPINAACAQEARALLLDGASFAQVLEDMQWNLMLDTIIPFARWFPKAEKLPRLFDTRFYLADLGTGAVDIAVDATENTHLFWISAQDAIDAGEAGALSIIFPTLRNLERLAQFTSFTQAKADAQKYPVRTIIPELHKQNGQRWLTIRDDCGYPVTRAPLSQVKRG